MRERAPLPISPENTLETPDRVVVRNRGEAAAAVLQTFQREQEKNYGGLAFHHEGHTEDVRHNGLEFAKIIMREDPSLVTKETLADIADSAGSHDSVLNAAQSERLTRFRGFYESDLEGEGKKQLRELMEKAGVKKGNERLSAEWLTRELERYVDPEGHQIFDATSKERMWRAIAATLPEFDFKATIPDEDYKNNFHEGMLGTVDLEPYRTGIKIWQPHLGPDSSMIELAIAEADLRGAVGSQKFDVFKKSGDAEFRESTLWVNDALKNGAESVVPEERKKIANAIVGWIKSQVTFAMWQKVLFWKAVDENTLISNSGKQKEIHEGLARRYNENFDANILEAKNRAEEIGKALRKHTEDGSLDEPTFKDLLTEIGYAV